MIRQRIIALCTTFYRDAGLWMSRHVSPQIRRTVFQSVINGAAPSGGEPHVFSTMRWTQLASDRMNLLRGAFAREAYSHTDKLRILSDSTLARRLNFPILESNTSDRRLKWYQSMLADPRPKLFYLATSLLSIEWERVSDFELNGSLAHRALPALRQLANDLTRFLPSWPGFVLVWVPIFLQHDFSGISSYDSTPRAMPSPTNVVVPASDEPFLKTFRVPGCISAPSAGRFVHDSGCSCTKPKYKVTRVDTHALQKQYVSAMQVSFRA